MFAKPLTTNIIFTRGNGITRVSPRTESYSVLDLMSDAVFHASIVIFEMVLLQRLRKLTSVQHHESRTSIIAVARHTITI